MVLTPITTPLFSPKDNDTCQGWLALTLTLTLTLTLALARLAYITRGRTSGIQRPAPALPALALRPRLESKPSFQNVAAGSRRLLASHCELGVLGVVSGACGDDGVECGRRRGDEADRADAASPGVRGVVATWVRVRVRVMVRVRASQP